MVRRVRNAADNRMTIKMQLQNSLTAFEKYGFDLEPDTWEEKDGKG